MIPIVIKYFIKSNSKVDLWRKEELTSFNWMEEAFNLMQVLMSDSVSTGKAVKAIMNLAQVKNNEYADVVSGFLGLVTNGQFDELIDG